MKKYSHAFVLALFSLGISGCLSSVPLVYTSSVTVGASVGASPQDNFAPSITVGLKQLDAAYVPVAVSQRCYDFIGALESMPVSDRDWGDRAAKLIELSKTCPVLMVNGTNQVNHGEAGRREAGSAVKALLSSLESYANLSAAIDEQKKSLETEQKALDDALSKLKPVLTNDKIGALFAGKSNSPSGTQAAQSPCKRLLESGAVKAYPSDDEDFSKCMTALAPVMGDVSPEMKKLAEAIDLLDVCKTVNSGLSSERGSSERGSSNSQTCDQIKQGVGSLVEQGNKVLAARSKLRSSEQTRELADTDTSGSSWRSIIKNTPDLAAELKHQLNVSDDKSDAYSVYGTFNSNTSAGAAVGNKPSTEKDASTKQNAVQLGVGKVFSTGVASQNLTQGLGRYYAVASVQSAIDSCYSSVEKTRETLAPKNLEAGIAAAKKQVEIDVAEKASLKDDVKISQLKSEKAVIDAEKRALEAEDKRLDARRDSCTEIIKKALDGASQIGQAHEETKK